MPAPRIRGYTRIPDLFMSQTRKLVSQTAVDPLNTDEISSNKLHADFFPGVSSRAFNARAKFARFDFRTDLYLSVHICINNCIFLKESMLNFKVYLMHN